MSPPARLPFSRSTRPAGQPTRGKTALNRLRQVDVYTALQFGSLLSGGAPLLVDVGYGAYPWTALEMFERLRRFNPHLRLLGLEIDPQRVETALPYHDPPRLEFRLAACRRTKPDRVLGTESERFLDECMLSVRQGHCFCETISINRISA